MPDGVDGGPEQEQVVESMQMRETKDLAATALSEPDEAYNNPEVAFLKQNWITDAIQKLEGPESAVISAADANISFPKQRAFLEAYLRHLGTPLKYDEIYNHVRTKGNNLPRIPEGQQLDFPTDPRVAWVERTGGRGMILTTTKIDGVQVELDAHRVADGPTAGWLHPVLHLSTK